MFLARKASSTTASSSASRHASRNMYKYREYPTPFYLSSKLTSQPHARSMDPNSQNDLDPTRRSLQAAVDATVNPMIAYGYGYAADGVQTPTVDENACWVHAHSAGTNLDYFHPSEPGNFPSGFPDMIYVDPFSNQYHSVQQPMNAPPDLLFPPQQTTQSLDEPSIPSSIAPSPEMVFHTSPFTPAVPTPSTSIATSRARSVSQASYTHAPPSIPYAGPSGLSVPLLVWKPAPIAASSSTSILASTSRAPSPSPLASIGNFSPQSNTWRCAFPGCSSKAHFARPCDLRKHFRRHSKVFFCRWETCPQSHDGALATAKARGEAAEGSPMASPEGLADDVVGSTAGFGSKKDRARHEASHNPGVSCESDACNRVFSRRDNMLDHARRIHGKGATV